ncbi:MAG: ABC transporter ATP-binding protein [Propionibacteriaceae bacterium]|jgi:ABC-type oligopeptide transport system ATPase subunit|nr:ABC transporter ATP-binding protein [Propionibacteriaceae bacterium]
MTRPLLQAEHVSKHFPVKNQFGRAAGVLRAVDDVTFTVDRGETLGLVGESGSGKTTLGRCLLQMEAVTSGRIVYAGTELTGLAPAARRATRRTMQVIFQDPYSSLNPQRTALQQVMEPLQVLAGDLDPAARAAATLARVGITGDSVHKLPRAFSGGERQRIGIARAIAVNPQFVVCDEPVSALDASIQAQILDLLAELQRDLGLTYLFISHDLSVVRHLATRTAVMHRGRLLELAPTAALFDDPRHPYTQALLAAIPVPDPRAARAARARGRPPAYAPPAEPGPATLAEVAPGHFVAAA